MFIPDKTKTNIIDASGMMQNWPLNQLPYRASDGTIKGSGLRIQTNGNLLAPVGFSVESGSVDFGDVIRLSESAGFLAFENMVDGIKYQLLDYAVPRDAPSSKPYYFKLASEEYKFEAVSDTSNTITTNPLTFQYTTKLTARTNALIFKAIQKMTNFRLRITDKKSGVAIKYFPSKSAWLDASGGTNFDIGDNVVDFQDTAVIFSANTDIIFDIQADNIALAGGSFIPYFAGMVQQGSFIGVANSIDVAGLQAQINQQQQSSFNGAYSSLVGVPKTFTPSPHTHVVADIEGLFTQLTGLSSAISNKLDSSSIIDITKVSGLQQTLTNKSDVSSVSQALSGKADASSISTVGKTGNYNDLNNKPVIPAAQVNSDWNSTSGLSQILNKPSIPNTVSQFSDASTYAKKTDINYPVISVNGKTGAVVISTADVSGLSTALSIKADASALSVVRRADNSLVARTKVKYYRVTSDATTGIWTVNLGTDFTELLDVQIVAESTSSVIGGIRQVSLNAYTSTSTSLTGMTFGSNTITTILVGGAQGLAIAPATAVRIRVEGIGS